MLKRIFGDPRLRLLYRALLAGGAILWVADEPLSKAALTAAAWAALEAFTPLNSMVGYLKGK